MGTGNGAGVLVIRGKDGPEVGLLSKQLCALLEVDTHDDAIGLGGFVRRDAVSRRSTSELCDSSHVKIA